MKSLRGRLLVCTTAGIGLVFLFSAVFTYTMVRSTLYREFDKALGSRARTLALLVDVEDGRIEEDFDEFQFREFLPSPNSELCQVWDINGSTIFRSPSLGNSNLKFYESEIDEIEFLNVCFPDKRIGRAATITFIPRNDDEHSSNQKNRYLGQKATLALCRDTAMIETTLAELRSLLSWGCGCMLILLILILHILLDRGLRPLRAVAKEIAAIGVNDLSQRLVAQTNPSELQPIVDKLNDLLEKMDSAFTREKGITADIAHELRTPLAGLRSTIEVSLSKERNAACHREDLYKSLAICLRMQRLVENLLELTRADAGQLETHPEKLDLPAFIMDRWQEYTEQASDRHLTVSWNMPTECLVTTDSTKIGTIITNLFDNAVTYTNSNGKILISLSNREDHVEFIINNTGCRVKTDDVSRVFDRFWRGETSRSATVGKRRYGLGLPLCKELSALIGGDLTVAITPDNEFSASLTIPVNLRVN